MHGGRIVIIGASALAVMAAAGAGVVAWPSEPLRLDDISGGACAGFEAPDLTRTMTVTVPLRNTSGHDRTVLGARATGELRTSRVRLRVVTGTDLGPNGFGTYAAMVHGRRATALPGSVLPAHSTSTVLVTITRERGADFASIEGLSLSYAGPLGTVRDATFDAWLGVTAPGSIMRCHPTGSQ
ncbi:hypothetical protein [Curtobacterium sp. PhB136]|uniref:hypothetical protein n=1 Tax=Curtobacterium sp. PhB136 TaxID=2485181 RepID=UPI0010461865|nr:hypothetical protein [Curtobacterium sp. PhB136]TCK66073.1 hypothetical protein EDF27_0825 [Curtobacterium sp. PhB136]